EAAQHLVTVAAAAHHHVHDDVVYKMASLGVFGVLATLTLYFVPATYFFRKLHHPDRETRTIASMGLALCLGFFTFGLSDVMFFWASSNTFYSVMLAGMFAHLIKREAELAHTVRSDHNAPRQLHKPDS